MGQWESEWEGLCEEQGWQLLSPVVLHLYCGDFFISLLNQSTEMLVDGECYRNANPIGSCVQVNCNSQALE